MTIQSSRTSFLRALWMITGYALPGLLYVVYLLYILGNTRAAVDYETFMSIGHSFRTGAPIWVGNSFYPLPMVLVFAFFDALPPTVSVLLWHVAPVAAALLIARGRPWPLLFAPLFTHFLGGQTALVGLVGLVLYRRFQIHAGGGVGLALLLLKPQLAIFPLLWAAWQWLKQMQTQRRLPAQALVFAAVALGIYLPSFLIMPDWVSQWLAHSRPLALRGLAGLLPRSLFILLSSASPVFWILLGTLALFLLIWLARVLKGRLTFDAYMLWSFVVNPFVHDYDLIQMIPLLDERRLYLPALLASVPLWGVAFFAYTNDSAWFAATLIAPFVLLACIRLYQRRLAATTDSISAATADKSSST